MYQINDDAIMTAFGDAFENVGIGRNANRRCTDLWGLVIFMFASVVMLCFAVLGFVKGDILEIVMGTDYNGNVCGKNFPMDIHISKEEWDSRRFLWYPISYDNKSSSFRVLSAIKAGICVKSCPMSGEVVYTYGGRNSNMPPSFRSVLKSSLQFNRCFPDFMSFNCSGDRKCNSNRDSQLGKTSDDLGFGNIFFTLATEFTRSWWIMLVIVVFSVIVSFIWIVLLRYLVKPVIICSIVLAVLLLAITGILGFYTYSNSSYRYSSVMGSFGSKTCLGVSITAFVCLAMVFMVLIFLWKRVMLACDIIQESSKVIAAIPTMIAIPLLVCVNIILNIFAMLFVIIALWSCGDIIKSTTVVQDCNGSLVTVDAYNFRRSAFVIPGIIYVIFYSTWWFLQQWAALYLSISLVGVQWFFSVPGDNKRVPPWPTWFAYTTTLSYHFGTTAGGSLLVAICRVTRFLMGLIERYLRQTQSRNTTCVKFICCCVKCLLCCFERILQFITERAYIITAINGRSLIPGAREGVSLLINNPAVLITDIIGDVIITCGKIFITLCICIIGYFWFKYNADGIDGVPNNSTITAQGLTLLLGLVVYYVTSLFGGVFSVCIDTIIMCYCWDKVHHNGADMPYYSPESLMRHISRAQDMIESKRKCETYTENQENYQTI